MKILAVDTSTGTGSVALLDGDRLKVEWSILSAQSHNRRLLKTIDHLIHQADWSLEDIDAYAVTKGPGSFTGVRIGLTTMKTLAWTMSKPFVSIPSLDALAAQFPYASIPICILLDARKKETYCAVYQSDSMGRLHELRPCEVIPPEKVMEFIRGPTIFCGDGWLLHREFFRQRLGDWAVGAPAPFHVIRACFVGELARRKLVSGVTDDPLTSAPLYVRPSEAELNRPQAVCTVESPLTHSTNPVRVLNKAS